MSNISYNEVVTETTMKVNGVEAASHTERTHAWDASDGDLVKCEFRLTDNVLSIDSDDCDDSLNVTLNNDIVSVIEHIARLYRDSNPIWR